MGLKETFQDGAETIFGYNKTVQDISPIPFLTDNFIYRGDKIMADLKSNKEKKICQVDGCNKPMRRNGYCERHAMQVTRRGKIIETYMDRPLVVCNIKWCRGKIYKNALCKKHFNQIMEYGKIQEEEKKICCVDWCDVSVHYGDYCSRHGMQMRRNGKIIETYIDRPTRICKVDGCEQPHSSNGYCSKHSMQVLYYGKVFDRTRHDLNEFRFESNICYMTLYDKYNNLKAEALIDLEDYEKVKDYKWGMNTYGYVFRSRVDFENREMYLSRFILSPKVKDTIIDYINRNPLDNRKVNLRKATRSQNSINSALTKNNSSGFKGVSWHKQHEKWAVSIHKKGHSEHLGYFRSKINAAKAYNKRAMELFGEFAWLNPIDCLEDV